MRRINVDPYEKRPISGQVSANSGSVTGLPDLEATRAVVRALPGNSAAVYVGSNAGTVSESNGYPLAAAGDAVYLEGIRNLNDLELLTLADGDGVGFLALYDPAANPLV